MSDEKRTYTWSHDGEHFECEEHASREDALEAGWDADPDGDHVWTGVAIPGAEVRPEINANDVIERLQEEAYGEVGEAAEDWLDKASKEQVAELGRDLNAALTAWLDRHKLQPTYFAVQDVEQHNREDRHAD